MSFFINAILQLRIYDLKESYFNIKIAKRLFLSVILVSTTVTLILTTIAAYLDYSAETDSQDQAVKTIRRTSLNALAEGIYAYDSVQIKNVSDGILNFQDVLKVSVVDDSGEQLYLKSRKTNDFASKHVKRFEMEILLDLDNSFLGTMKLEVSQSAIWMRVFERMLNFCVLQAIKTFLTSLIILWLFRKILTKHILYLSRFFQAINLNSETVDQVICLKRDRRWNDELTKLADVSNRMIRKISENKSIIH